jgi:hypothetical protein
VCPSAPDELFRSPSFQPEKLNDKSLFLFLYPILLSSYRRSESNRQSWHLTQNQ